MKKVFVPDGKARSPRAFGTVKSRRIGIVLVEKDLILSLVVESSMDLMMNYGIGQGPGREGGQLGRRRRGQISRPTSAVCTISLEHEDM